MKVPAKSREVSAKKAVELIRGNISNGDLMEMLKISAKGFADLLRQLFERKLIDEEDLAKRGIKYKVIKRDNMPVLPINSEEAVSGPVPPQYEMDTSFLDTVELTELLSTSGSGAPILNENDANGDVENKKAEAQSSSRKSRFSFGNLFKKKE